MAKQIIKIKSDHIFFVLGRFFNMTKAALVLLILFLVNFLENYGRYLYSVSIIPFIDTYSYEYSLLNGLLFSFFYGIGGLVFIMVTEIMLNNNPKHFKYQAYILTVASFFFSLSLGLTVFCTNFSQLAIIRVIMGLTQSAMLPYSTSIIGYYFEDVDKGFAIATIQVGTYVAYSASLSLGTYCYDIFGWKFGYVLISTLGCLVALFIPVILFSNPPIRNKLTFNSQRSSVHDYPKSQNGGVGTSLQDTQTLLTMKNDRISYVNVAIADSSEIESTSTIDSLTSTSSNSYVLPLRIQFVNLSKRILISWVDHPYLFFLCLSTGIRLGAGYIWGSYTTAFFSELWIPETIKSGLSQEYQTCSYSYNASYTDGNSNIPSNVCTHNYPYCVDASEDNLINYCCKKNLTPWHNEGISHGILEAYVSWMPIVGSGVGSVLGGFLSDTYAKRYGLKFRPFLIGVGNILASPFIYLAFNTTHPYCFLVQVLSGFLGEMYFGQSIAILVIVLGPTDLVLCSVAVYLLLTSTIAGSIVLIVPSLYRYYFHYYGDISIITTISQFYNQLNSTSSIYYSLTLQGGGGISLQSTLTSLMVTIYLVSGLMYVSNAAYFYYVE